MRIILTLLLVLTTFASAKALSADIFPMKKNGYPDYPLAALSKDLHGWVLLEFTVQTDGSVIDVEVVENCATIEVFYCDNEPNNIFDKSALKAAQSYVYQVDDISFKERQYERVQSLVTYELGHKPVFTGDKQFYCDREAQLSAIAFHGFGQQQSERLTKKKQKGWHKDALYKEENRDIKTAKKQLANFALTNGDQLRKNLYRSKDTRLKESMSALTFEQIKESSRKTCLLR